MEGIGAGAEDWLPTLLSNLEAAFAATDWGKLGVSVVDGIIDQIRLSASRLFGAIMDALLAGGAGGGSGGTGSGGGGGGGSGADGAAYVPTGGGAYTGGGYSGKIGGKVGQSPVYRTATSRALSAATVSGARSVNVNFGGVTINNGMDLGVLDARIRQTATQAMRMMA